VMNTRLRLTPAAWAGLSAGDVDPRLLEVLGRLAARHRLDISDLSPAAGEDPTGSPARSVTVTAVDGAPVGVSTPAVADVLHSLRTQPPPYRPDRSAVATGSGQQVLVISYLAPSPFGLPAAPTP
jgi:hypothetical protein